MDFKEDIPGWLHTNEVNALLRICRMAPPSKKIIEVGVFAGRSTQVLASCCPTSDIYCVDPWPVLDHPIQISDAEYKGPLTEINSPYDIFQKQIAPRFYNVHEVRGWFPNDLPDEVKQDVGLIYFDTDTVGDPDKTFEMLNAGWGMLANGGILSGHSLAYWMPSMVKVVRHLSLVYNVDIVLPPSGSIWYAFKTLQ